MALGGNCKVFPLVPCSSHAKSVAHIPPSANRKQKASERSCVSGSHLPFLTEGDENAAFLTRKKTATITHRAPALMYLVQDEKWVIAPLNATLGTKAVLHQGRQAPTGGTNQTGKDLKDKNMHITSSTWKAAGMFIVVLTHVQIWFEIPPDSRQSCS